MEGVQNNQAGDISVHVFELRESGGGDVFHNRCILTEHGGIKLGRGQFVTCRNKVLLWVLRVCMNLNCRWC